MTLTEDDGGTITIVAEAGWTDQQYDDLLEDHGVYDTKVTFDDFTSTDTHDTWTLSRVPAMAISGGGA